MDIHITGPGTGQMYQTFLSEGSVTINLGGIRPPEFENTERAYSSYFEQHMTSGTPYIKGLYYPINQRPKGIKKDKVIKLIRQASRLILQGFSLPLQKRIPETGFDCLNFWTEDFVHEYRQWQLGGFLDNGRNISCPFNRSLLHELRKKYGIHHKETNNSSKNATHNSVR
ncbi:unnamed protein product, partial [Rotaria sp. Silwood2]